MTTEELRLSMSERRRLDRFLEPEGVQSQPGVILLVAGSFAMIGLLLVIATTVIAVDGLNSFGFSNLNGNLMWMYVSGIVSGAVITSVGVLLFLRGAKLEDRQRLSSIVRKLLNETT